MEKWYWKGLFRNRLYLTSACIRHLMPNQGQLYLMAVAGAGQGMVGSSANRDHLQRGIVKKAEDNNVYEENGRCIFRYSIIPRLFATFWKTMDAPSVMRKQAENLFFFIAC